MGQVTQTNFGLVTRKTWTNAQVIARQTTPLVIQAGIPGKVILPERIVMTLDPWVADYGAINVAAAITMTHAGAASTTLEVTINTGEITLLLAAGTARFLSSGVSRIADNPINITGLAVQLQLANG